MKISIEDIQIGEEEQIIIKCHEMTPEIFHLLSAIKSLDAIIAYDGGEIHRLMPAKIYYIEAVDNKTFLYTKEKVYESKQKLYELEETLGNGDFLRVSKSVILNLSKVKCLAPALNGRFEAALGNGEKVIISRQYVNSLKKRLNI